MADLGDSRFNPSPGSLVPGSFIKRNNYDEDKTQKWFRNEDGKSFLEYIRQKYVQEDRQLRSASDLITIGRYQGKLEILEWLIKLREES